MKRSEFIKKVDRARFRIEDGWAYSCNQIEHAFGKYSYGFIQKLHYGRLMCPSSRGHLGPWLSSHKDRQTMRLTLIDLWEQHVLTSGEYKGW
ncbi:MAG: hypothetical protein Unbinned1322contig1000_14 [Prokaryotic dsDNA virus sp.]|nr:hypothetical protein [Aequorivita sp.]QDP57270.1 MAG: hypothetical protein Unbinned1322contig1000_14 [Prokaryotic dsDNA virus sp.]